MSSSGTEQSLTLRLTGLWEEAGEDKESLLQKVAEVLHALPCRVSASDASRQGKAGSRSARAVIMTLTSVANLLLRMNVCPFSDAKPD